MEMTGSELTKIPGVFQDRSAKLFRQPGRLEARQRQMRRERPLFPRNAELFRGLFDLLRQNLQIRRSLDTRPENARMFFVWKKTEPPKIEGDRLIGAYTRQSISNGSKNWLWHFTYEFQRHMKILRTHPASLRRNRAKGFKQIREIFSHCGGNLQRNEQTHGRSGPLGTARRRLPAVVEEMNAHQIERQLRGVPADGFAIAREDHAALFDAAGMRKRDVYRAHGLFLASAARTRDASDAHTQRAANLAANTVGQRNRHLAADRTFRLDEFRRHICPRRLQLVAVADDAAQKIRRTARDARQPLRQQSAGAAFRGG